MIIKKVQSSRLTGGEIYDNWSGTSDKEMNAPSINSVQKYVLEQGYTSKTEVMALISESNHIHIEIVDALPTTDIDESAIYLVPNGQGLGDNVYDEYVYTENGWQPIGNTAIDVSKFATKEYAANLATLPNGSIIDYDGIIAPEGYEEVEEVEVVKSYRMSITSTINSGTEITIPAAYRVGTNCLDVYLNGEKLIKSTDDFEGHYKEIGTAGSMSTKILLDGTTTPWSVVDGDVFEFIVRSQTIKEIEEFVPQYLTITDVDALPAIDETTKQRVYRYSGNLYYVDNNAWVKMITQADFDQQIGDINAILATLTNV